MKLAVHCPEHPKQVIGIVDDDADARFDHGFWCPQCGKHKYFNENNIKKYLTKKSRRYNKKENVNYRAECV